MKKFLSRIAVTMLAICLLGLAACGQSSGTNSTSGSTSSLTDFSASLRVSFIDVGKGDCVLVQADGSAALIDTGYENTADDVLSYLQDQGVSHLSALILTHYDRDHIGGVGKIGKGMDVDAIYLPGYEGSDNNYRSCIAAVEELGVPTQKVNEEVALTVGDAHLSIFPSGVAYEPAANDDEGEGNDNDASLVTTLVYGSDSFLFAGDIEKDGIAAYLEAKHGRFDVLKLPHHGRRSSNTGDLLDDVCPKIAVITDSKKDPANKKVLKMLKSADVKTYRTRTKGTIVVKSNGTGTYKVSTSKG